MVGLSFQSMGVILWLLRDFFCTGCCDGDVFLCNGGLESSCRLCIRSERKCKGDIIEDEDSDVFLCWYVAVLRWQSAVGILSGTGWAFDSGQTEFNGNGTEHKVLASVLLQYCGCFEKTQILFFEVSNKTRMSLTAFFCAYHVTLLGVFSCNLKCSINLKYKKQYLSFNRLF